MHVPVFQMAPEYRIDLPTFWVLSRIDWCTRIGRAATGLRFLKRSPVGSAKRAKPSTGGGPPDGGTVTTTGGLTAAPQQDVSRLKRPDLKCDHCGKLGHQKSACWQLHPELDPKTPQGKQMRLRDKARTRAERAKQMGFPWNYDWSFGGQYPSPPPGGYAGGGYGQPYMLPPLEIDWDRDRMQRIQRVCQTQW